MGLTGNKENTALGNAIKDRETLGTERLPQTKTYYDLKIAKDPSLPSSQVYWNPNATGGPIIRVVSPFDPKKVLFLRVVNFADGDAVPRPSTHGVTGTLEPKDFSKRADDEKLPRDLPSRGLDGIAYVVRLKPKDVIPDQTLSANPNDVFNGKTTEGPSSQNIMAQGGGGIKIHKDGVDLLDATGEGVVFGKGGVRFDKPIDTTELKEGGMLIDSPVKTWVGVPECIVTIPAWEKWPDITKIVAWANVAAFAIQAIDKIKRGQEAMRKMS